MRAKQVSLSRRKGQNKSQDGENELSQPAKELSGDSEPSQARVPVKLKLARIAHAVLFNWSQFGQILASLQA